MSNTGQQFFQKVGDGISSNPFIPGQAEDTTGITVKDIYRDFVLGSEKDGTNVHFVDKLIELNEETAKAGHDYTVIFSLPAFSSSDCAIEVKLIEYSTADGQSSQININNSKLIKKIILKNKINQNEIVYVYKDDNTGKFLVSEEKPTEDIKSEPVCISSLLNNDLKDSNTTTYEFGYRIDKKTNDKNSIGLLIAIVRNNEDFIKKNPDGSYGRIIPDFDMKIYEAESINIIEGSKVYHFSIWGQPRQIFFVNGSPLVIGPSRHFEYSISKDDDFEITSISISKKDEYQARYVIDYQTCDLNKGKEF